MIVATCKVYMRDEAVFSLKEKRMIVKSIINRLKNKFNISVAEVEDQDIHKSIVIGFACVTNETSHANSIVNNVLNFIENNCEADIVDTVIEFF